MTVRRVNALRTQSIGFYRLRQLSENLLGLVAASEDRAICHRA